MTDDLKTLTLSSSIIRLSSMRFIIRCIPFAENMVHVSFKVVSLQETSQNHEGYRVAQILT